MDYEFIDSLIEKYFALYCNMEDKIKTLCMSNNTYGDDDVIIKQNNEYIDKYIKIKDEAKAIYYSLTKCRQDLIEGDINV